MCLYTGRLNLSQNHLFDVTNLKPFISVVIFHKNVLSFVFQGNLRNLLFLSFSCSIYRYKLYLLNISKL